MLFLQPLYWLRLSHGSISSTLGERCRGSFEQRAYRLDNIFRRLGASRFISRIYSMEARLRSYKKSPSKQSELPARIALALLLPVRPLLIRTELPFLFLRHPNPLEKEKEAKRGKKASICPPVRDAYRQCISTPQAEKQPASRLERSIIAEILLSQDLRSPRV